MRHREHLAQADRFIAECKNRIGRHTPRAGTVIDHLDRRGAALHTAPSIPACSKPWVRARRASLALLPQRPHQNKRRTGAHIALELLFQWPPNGANAETANGNRARFASSPSSASSRPNQFGELWWSNRGPLLGDIVTLGLGVHDLAHARAGSRSAARTAKRSSRRTKSLREISSRSARRSS